MRPVALLPVDGRMRTTSGGHHPPRRWACEVHTSGSPCGRSRSAVESLLSGSIRGRGADMGRSPDRPYPRPRVRLWTVGRWEMWQLRGPVVAVVLLVCGIGRAARRRRARLAAPHRPRDPDDRRARAARAGAHRDREQGRADAPARLRHVVLRPQLRLDLRGRPAAPPTARRDRRRRGVPAPVGAGVAAREEASSTATSTPPPRSSSRPRPRTPSSAPRAGFRAGAPERSGWPCSPWPSSPTPWSTTFS